MSSKTDQWFTPQPLFDSLNSEFHFTVDVCACEISAKCAKYFTKEQDGLSQNWGGDTVWMNPPYGREIGPWVKKASENYSVCLLPARTDTKWFHDYIWNHPNREIRFIKGRIKFSGAEYGAPFPSMIVIFNKPIETEI